MGVMYTTFGCQTVVDYIDGTVAGSETNYIGAGTGAGSYVKGTVALWTEVAEARIAAAKSQPAADKNQWQATQVYTLGVPKTITNAAVCKDLAGSTVMLGVDGLSVLVSSGDSIQFTFTLQQT